ncbi:MAG: discoidin domain-containing protein [Bacteroidota bacterium]
MNLSRLLIISLLIVLPNQLAFANGGPISGSYVQKSGNIKLITQHDIEILKEDLNIQIDGDYCNVEVTYLFKNRGAANDVKYGFPVDFIPSDGYYYPDTEYVAYFNYLYDNQSLKHTIILEDSVQVDHVVSNYGGRENVSRRWYITDLHFDANATKELKVRYRILSNHGDYPRGLDHFSYYSERMFFYDLKPAGFWGDGKIGEFNLQIERSQDLYPDEIQIAGIGDLKVDNNAYSKTIEDYQVSGAALLEIFWDRSSVLLFDELSDALPSKTIKHVTASSRLHGNYAPENLIDRDHTTAWVEGKEGEGIGEWVEFEFNENVIISGIAILNGYTKSEGTYVTNNQVKSYTIEIYSKNGDVVNKEVHTKGFEEQSVRKYKMINKRYFYLMVDIALDSGGLELVSEDIDELIAQIGTTSKIRFRIDGVYKGTKYNDTCISEILFYGVYK